MTDSGSVGDAAERLKRATKKLLNITNELKEIKVEFMSQKESLFAALRRIEDGEEVEPLVRKVVKESADEFDRFAEDMRREAGRMHTIAEELQGIVPKREIEPVIHGPPLILKCKQWSDFTAMVCQAQRLTFLYDEAEEKLEAHGLKNSLLITYSGDFPERGSLLKAWLSNRLRIPEERIVEGILTRD